jgi:hypothetical protein
LGPARRRAHCAVLAGGGGVQPVRLI